MVGPSMTIKASGNAAIEKIGLLDTPGVDLSALRTCTALESVDVSADAENIECLKDLPNLKRLNGQAPAEFWRD